MSAEEQPAPPITFRLLGPIKVVDDDGGEVDVGHPLQRAVLSLLLLSPGSAVDVDTIIKQVWAHRAANANGVHVYVHRLRAALKGLGVGIDKGRGGYTIGVDRNRVDLHRFRALTARSAADPGRSRQLLAEALELWRGEAFAGTPAQGLIDRRSQLDEERLNAFLSWTDLELGAGGHRELIGRLRQEIERRPTHEGLVARLMLGLYRDGRTDDALAAYHACAQAMEARPDRKPGRELRQLRERILKEDETLDVGAPARPRLPAPALMPRDVAGFVGRGREIAQLNQLIPAARPVVPGSIALIVGPPGVGKTALAVHWVHRRARDFPGGCLYADLRTRDGTEQDLGAVLDTFLTAFDVAPARLSLTIEAKVALYRTLMHSRRMVVVLENVRSLAQVENLLPNGAGTLTVLTSRGRLTDVPAAGVRRIELKPLDAEASMLLLRAALGQVPVGLTTHLEQLCEACGGMPIALTVAAARIGHSPPAAVGALVAAFVDPRTRLAAFGATELAVAAVIQWSYAALPGPAAAVFRRLGLHPTPVVTTAIAAALAGLDRHRTGELLGILVDAHLVEDDGDGRCTLHELFHLYAANRSDAEDAEDQRTAALHRMHDRYLSLTVAAMDTWLPDEERNRSLVDGLEPLNVREEFPDTVTARNWLSRHRPDLLAVARQAAARHWTSRVRALAGALFRFLDHGGYLDDAVELHTLELACAEESGDARAAADACLHLGAVLVRAAEYDRSAELLDRALVGYAALGDTHGQGRVLSNLGRVYVRIGEPELAIRQYREAVAHFVAAVDGVAEARARTNLGTALNRAGRLAEAEVQHHKAVSGSREAGIADGEARALGNLAMVLQAQGRYQEAEAHHQQALRIFEALGDAVGEAVTLTNLGVLCRLVGDCPRAVHLHERAMTIFEDIGDRSSLLEVLNDMGLALTGCGRLQQAESSHLRAIALATATGHRGELARGHTGLGRRFLAAGDVETAARHALLARDAAPATASPELTALLDDLAASG